MDADEIRPLELLHRVAQRLEAVVCLTSTADARDPNTHRRVLTCDEGARLMRLAVVRPGEGIGRWDTLNRGTVLAAHLVGANVRLDDVADLLLVVLAPFVRA